MGSHCNDSYHSLVNERQSYGSDYDFGFLLILYLYHPHGSDMFNMPNAGYKSYLSLHERLGFRCTCLGG